MGDISLKQAPICCNYVMPCHGTKAVFTKCIQESMFSTSNFKPVRGIIVYVLLNCSTHMRTDNKLVV